MDLKSLARDERTDLADFLETLSPEQWDAPTLCGEWRVRDLVAHLVSYDDLSLRDMAGRFVKGRFTLDGANDVGLAEYGGRTSGELLALARKHVRPAGVMAWSGGVVALTGGVIHHQDIRRPLGLPREIPAERLVAALRGALKVPVFGGARRARRLRLVATDLDWSRGSGPEARGSAEAILMAIAGRPSAVGELSGPGRELLAERVAR
ncbi:maleylpyruvate isomerase family mycothiol-dependent enzyme [Actinomadura chokoriensis]|uniref:Maleylpyruvate isomerase family mycothiol-dependent enzyme n=1 Tax=Actinomadura chokoriensis TaxID=454156 RepID=A0ABV4QRT5_9ACTN